MHVPEAAVTDVASRVQTRSRLPCIGRSPNAASRVQTRSRLPPRPKPMGGFGRSPNSTAVHWQEFNAASRVQTRSRLPPRPSYGWVWQEP